MYLNNITLVTLRVTKVIIVDTLHDIVGNFNPLLYRKQKMSVKICKTCNQPIVVSTIATKIKPKLSGRKSIETLRKEYGDIQRQFLMWVKKERLDAAVRSNLAVLMVELNRKKASPELWVKAIKQTTIPCDKCQDGIYHGRYTSSKCYRCAGKGKMDAKDCVRTGNYYKNRKAA